MANRTVMSAINRAAPIVAAVVLAALLAVGGIDAKTPEGVDEYHKAVREAVDRIPYRIGPWVGQDIETPPAAVKLLKPNTLMQRRYTDPATGENFNLLLVHCGDMRDMQGHYPPICYPAHGWTHLGAQMTYFDVGADRLPARSYRFEREVQGSQQRMAVIGFFVLPDGTLAADIKDLNRRATNRSLTGLGAAQVQLVVDEMMSQERRREILEEIGRTIEPTIRVIARNES